MCADVVTSVGAKCCSALTASMCHLDRRFCSCSLWHEVFLVHKGPPGKDGHSCSFCNGCLACPGGGTADHGLPIKEGLHGIALEGVQWELEGGLKVGQHQVRAASRDQPIDLQQRYILTARA